MERNKIFSLRVQSLVASSNFSLNLLFLVGDSDAHAEADALLVQELCFSLLDFDVHQLVLLQDLLLQQLVVLVLDPPLLVLVILKERNDKSTAFFISLLTY